MFSQMITVVWVLHKLLLSCIVTVLVILSSSNVAMTIVYAAKDMRVRGMESGNKRAQISPHHRMCVYETCTHTHFCSKLFEYYFQHGTCTVSCLFKCSSRVIL